MRRPSNVIAKPRALGFYRGQAYRAATCGISVDVLCFANGTCEHFGLSSIAPLALTTGGGVHRCVCVWGGGSRQQGTGSMVVVVVVVV